MLSWLNRTNSLDGDEARPMDDASTRVEAPSSSVKRKKRKTSAPNSDDKKEEAGGGDTSGTPAADGASDECSGCRHCRPCVVLRLPPLVPGGVAQEWVGNHKSYGEVAVYTDGSVLLSEWWCQNGRGCGGAGIYANRWGKQELFAKSIMLGPGITSNEAEMVGLICGVEEMQKYCEDTNTRTLQEIHFFSDSTNALRNIYQSLLVDNSTRFYLAMDALLRQNPNLRVTLEWVPGHENIYGNEKADDLARRASESARDWINDYLRGQCGVQPYTRNRDSSHTPMTSQRWAPRTRSRN